jgi:hypothetical protein
METNPRPPSLTPDRRRLRPAPRRDVPVGRRLRSLTGMVVVGTLLLLAQAAGAAQRGNAAETTPDVPSLHRGPARPPSAGAAGDVLDGPAARAEIERAIPERTQQLRERAVALLADPAHVVPEVYRPLGDVRLDRLVLADRIEIPAGVLVEVEPGAALVARHEIVIEGTIVAASAAGEHGHRSFAEGRDRAAARMGSAEGQARHGGDILLVAGQRISLHGELLPTSGSAGVEPGEPGGDGGSIVLDAPTVVASCDLVAADGAAGGPGAPGGRGGSVLATGTLHGLDPALPFQAIAGPGGDGGAGLAGSLHFVDGGDGGRGGSALVAGRVATSVDAGGRLDGAVDGDNGDNNPGEWTDGGADGLDGGPCQDGGRGLMAFSTWAGTGGKGGHGADATQDGESGGTGGNGGNGGDARSGDGGWGGDGGPCSADCNAGDGGVGGPGAQAVAGSGNAGGDGGDGLGTGLGGHGGWGGDGGDARAGKGGWGGNGGDCCHLDPTGPGGRGAAAGDASLARAWGGHGAAGGRGGHADSLNGTGGDGGDGGHGGDGQGGYAGYGGDGGDGDGPGPGGPKSQPGAGHLGYGAPGGTAGWPNGEHGVHGDNGTGDFGFAALDGDDGDPCGDASPPPDEEDSEDYADGTWEDAYGWQFESVLPPVYGAFAERFILEREMVGAYFRFTTMGEPGEGVMDAFVWADDGGRPGPVLALRTGVAVSGVPAYPEVRGTEILGLHAPAGLSCWLGYWGAWPGQPAGWRLAVDRDGPGGGLPSTNVAPGQGWPEGWQPMAEIFGPTAAVGIAVLYDDRGACVLDTDCCRVRSRRDCEADGGLFAGPGSFCEDQWPERGDMALHDVGSAQLSVTDQGILGFLDATQTEGEGLRFPAGGPNHLYIGSLWVGATPGKVANRDYDADPGKDWEVSFCPGGRMEAFTTERADQAFATHFEEGGSLGTDGASLDGLLVAQQSLAWGGSGPESRAILLQYTLYNRSDEAFRDLVAGLFLDLDVSGAGGDDVAGVQGDVVWIGDPGGSHTGVRLLDPIVDEEGPIPVERANATLVPNPLFVYPNEYVTEEDKHGFLRGEPGHVFDDGAEPSDYSALVSAGPFDLAPGARVTIAFAVGAGDTLAELLAALERVGELYRPPTTAIGSPLDSADAGEGGLSALRCRPSPFVDEVRIEYEAPRGLESTLAVYDAGGRMVQRLAAGRVEASPEVVRWDGRDAQGREVSAGVYFLRLDVGGERREVRLLRLRH